MYIVQERLLVESEYRQVLQWLVSQVLLSNSIELYANIRKAKFVSCRVCKLANSAADKLRFAILACNSMLLLKVCGTERVLVELHKQKG